MPAVKTKKSAPAKTYQYAVFDDGRVVHGSARKILQEINDSALKRINDGRKRTTEQFARILIENADFHIPAGILDYVPQMDFPTLYDRALFCLSEMGSSDVRILTKDVA